MSKHPPFKYVWVSGDWEILIRHSDQNYTRDNQGIYITTGYSLPQCIELAQKMVDDDSTLVCIKVSELAHMTSSALYEYKKMERAKSVKS